jgi:hypothetical protein
MPAAMPGRMEFRSMRPYATLERRLDLRGYNVGLAGFED